MIKKMGAYLSAFCLESRQIKKQIPFYTREKTINQAKFISFSPEVLLGNYKEALPQMFDWAYYCRNMHEEEPLVLDFGPPIDIFWSNIFEKLHASKDLFKEGDWLTFSDSSFSFKHLQDLNDLFSERQRNEQYFPSITIHGTPIHVALCKNQLNKIEDKDILTRAKSDEALLETNDLQNISYTKEGSDEEIHILKDLSAVFLNKVYVDEEETLYDSLKL